MFKNTYTLTVSVRGAGTMVFPSVGTHEYAAGTRVALLTIPKLAWPFPRFLGWDGDVANPRSILTYVIMDADQTVTANFTCTARTLTVDAPGAAEQKTDSVLVRLHKHPYDNFHCPLAICHDMPSLELLEVMA